VTLQRYQGGEELTAARMNELVRNALQNIVGVNGIVVGRSGNNISIGLERLHRGVPPAAFGGGGTSGGGFVACAGASPGSFTADGAWHTVDLSASYPLAVLFLMEVSFLTPGALLAGPTGGPPSYYIERAPFGTAGQWMIPATGGSFDYNLSSPGNITMAITGYWK
jgi:hypothetical protein